MSIIIEGPTFYPGETAHVCLSQDNDFICPTTNTSTNLTCDKDRCPLQGPPMAPIMESQTGWSSTHIPNQWLQNVLFWNLPWDFPHFALQVFFGNFCGRRFLSSKICWISHTEPNLYIFGRLQPDLTNYEKKYPLCFLDYRHHSAMEFINIIINWNLNILCKFWKLKLRLSFHILIMLVCYKLTKYPSWLIGF